MNPSSKRRETVNLSRSVHQQLSMYALAAGAGVLAIAQPAGAKIVYTPAHVRLVGDSYFRLDLNHDRIADFTLALSGFVNSGFTSSLAIAAPGGNDACGYRGVVPFASALRAGIRVGPKREFLGGPNAMGILIGTVNRKINYYGPWVNGGKGVKNRYLGLKVVIRGKTHFGWARLDVATVPGFTATLTGYAYETIPGKSILTGKTKGPDVPTVSPASLGHLAAGASAIPAWRSAR